MSSKSNKEKDSANLRDRATLIVTLVAAIILVAGFAWLNMNGNKNTEAEATTVYDVNKVEGSTEANTEKASRNKLDDIATLAAYDTPTKAESKDTESIKENKEVAETKVFEESLENVTDTVKDVAELTDTNIEETPEPTEVPAEPTDSNPTSTSDFDVLYLEEQELYAQSSVNIRSGAGINYEKVGSLSLNEAVTVDGLAVTTEGKEWFQLVNSEGSLIGYVSASYLGKEKVQETPATTTNNQTEQSNESTTETPSQAPTGDNSLTGAGTTAPSGAKVGRGDVNRFDGSSQGGSGKGDHLTFG